MKCLYAMAAISPGHLICPFCSNTRTMTENELMSLHDQTLKPVICDKELNGDEDY